MARPPLTDGLPLQPLLDAAHITAGQLGRRVGTSGKAVKDAGRRGLYLGTADRWALRLGLMPDAVWDDWWTR